MSGQLSRVNFLGFLLTFFMIGVVQALYGPLVGSFMSTLNITYTQAGSLLGVHFIGALLGVLIFHPTEQYGYNPRNLLWLSIALMIIGSVGVALAPTFIILLLADFICGLGFGGIDYGLTYIFSSIFTGKNATAMLNLLNACFGVGAIVGPGYVLLVGYSVTTSFLLFSIGSFICLIMLWSLPELKLGETRTHKNENKTKQIVEQTKKVSSKSIKGIVIITLFLVLYIFHVGAETGIAGWSQSYLEWKNYSSELSTNFVMGFWLAMTASRFIIIPIARRISGKIILGICNIGLFITLLIPLFEVGEGIAFIIAGFFIGPIFPTGIPWLKESLKASGGVLSLLIALSMLGGVIFPPLIGSLITKFGFISMIIVLVILAGFMLISYILLLRLTKQKQ